MAVHPAIPSERPITDRVTKNVLSRIRESLELLTGRRPGSPKIAKLDSAATTAEAVSKINEILDRMQD
jgi:hypothetical protein